MHKFSLLMRKHQKKAVCALLVTAFSATCQTGHLHIIPDHVGDSHFTSGPCPNIAPPDGAACPNGTATCPAFYNPSLLPPGYNSVSYCATVPAGIGFNSPGITMQTKQLDAFEQAAFLKAAAFIESVVQDDQTVVMEPYKVDYLDQNGNNYLFFGGNEYWIPVCAADALMPPFTNQQPVIVQNTDGSYSYQGLPETYTPVLEALQQKNATNTTPMTLIDYLPTQSEINVEWPPTFYGWQDPTDLASDQVSNYLVQPSYNYPITPTAQPFTLCGAPSVMKMLGFGPMFAKNGHTIDDINGPQYNMNVTLSGTDGAVVIPDLEGIPPGSFSWDYDSTNVNVQRTQLPKAYYERSLNYYLPNQSCSDPTQCQYPKGFNPGTDLIGVYKHEIDHMLGVMQSQYYKVSGVETSIAYTYGTALYLLDLFDIDSDYVVPGYGHPGIQSYADFTAAPRNNNTYEPQTIFDAGSIAELTPFVQFGKHDHVIVYDVSKLGASYFPLMNDTVGNPDGDIQFQEGFVYGNTSRPYLVDPVLQHVPELAELHFNAQAAGLSGTIDVMTIREYSELAANGWDIDYKTLRDPYHILSPLAEWYRYCFDSNGNFTQQKDKNCKFDVTPGVQNH